MHQIKNREVIYSNLKFSVSVQGQNWCNFRTPIHQRGEQTLNKQARTDGEIRDFPANTNAVANRSYQAENLSRLHKMCNLITKLNNYKQVRPSYILRSDVLQNGLQILTIPSKITILTRSIRFWEKRHFTTSVLVLQCLLRLLIIFSYYMKREKIFPRIFSKVE